MSGYLQLGDTFADRVRMAAGVGGDSGTIVKLCPGLIFKLSHEKLKAGLLARGEHHTTRANEKEAALPQLKELVVTLDQTSEHLQSVRAAGLGGKTAANFNNYGFDGKGNARQLEEQIEALEKDIREHRNKATAFTFLAESLFETTYALSWEDLKTIEFAPR